MLSKKFIWDPQQWRSRAEEARTVADQMTHEDARTIMRRIALDYDRLAKPAEEQLADQDSCDPLLATHFLLEKQVEARAHGASGTTTD
jgi:hypothetical protein